MQHYKIGDLATVISERIENPSKNPYSKFVGLEHYISGEIQITKYGDAKKLQSAVKVFKSGDVLVARRNVYLKRASVVFFDGVTSGDSIVLRPSNELAANLLPYVLNSNKFWEYATRYADGTMSKRLSPKKLLEYEFDLPDVSEQIRLAKILWAVEENKVKVKSAIQCLITYRAILLPLLISEGWNAAHIDNRQFPKRVKTTLSNKNYFQVVSGGTPDSSNPEYWNGDITWITLDDLPPENFITEITKSRRHISDKGLQNSSAKLLPVNSVITSTRATIGRVGINRCELATNQGFQSIIIKDKNNVCCEYLALVMTSLTQELISRAGRSTYKEISKKRFSEIEINLPSIEEQMAIVSVMESIDNHLKVLENSLKSTCDLMSHIVNTTG